MAKITCKLNGIKYLLVECPITSDTSVKKFEERCKKHECIMQGAKIYKGGFFSNSYLIAKILVPEKNVIEWNNNNTKLIIA